MKRAPWASRWAKSDGRRALRLTESDWTRYKDWFDALADTLKSRSEQARKKHEDWRVRQEAGLKQLVEVRARAQKALDSIRRNIEQNNTRLASSSGSRADNILGWIREDEDKLADIERSLVDLDAKIRDARARLSQ